MATTYNYIAANKRRSLLLIVIFILVVGFIGWAFGKLSASGPAGIIIAVVIAVIMTFVSYTAGDKIALFAAAAQGPIKKEDNPYLFNLVENLCIANGQPVPQIYLLPDPQINAFATGRDPQHGSIAITAGAVKKLENEELEGVLAHELSHLKNYDSRYMMLVAILVGIITLMSQFFWRASWLGGGRRRNDSEGGGQLQAILMIIGLVLLILAPIIGQLIQLAISRKREFLADASAALLTRYPEGLARALEKISTDTVTPLDHANNATAHLYISNPFGSKSSGINKLFSTHPPIAERIQALRAMDRSPRSSS